MSFDTDKKKVDIADAENSLGKADDSVGAVTARILRTDRNALRLSLATLVCILSVMMTYIVSCLPVLFLVGDSQIPQSALEVFMALLMLLMLMCGIVFLCVPCVSGYVSFSVKLARGENPPFVEIFAPFRSAKRYFASFSQVFAIALRVMIFVMPLVGGIVSMELFGKYSIHSTIELAARTAYDVFAIVAVLCVSAFFSSYLYFAPYLISCGMKARAAFRESVRMSKQRRIEIIKQSFSQTGRILLAIISFGVLFVLYTAPHMSVSYAVYCEGVLRDASNNNNE